MSQENKVSKFVEAINREAQQRREKINRETEEYMARELKKATVRAKAEGKAISLKRMAVIHEDIGRELSRNLQESKKEVILRRDEIERSVFQDAHKRLRDFTETSEYLALLLASAKAAATGIGEIGAVYMRQEDLRYAAEIIAVTGGEARVDSTIKIGGLRFESADRTVIADDTLESRLEGNKGWFRMVCGLHIYS